MSIQHPEFPSFAYIRTCQSCGHKQVARDPNTISMKMAKETWRSLKCAACGAEDMDYGSTNVDVVEEKDES